MTGILEGIGKLVDEALDVEPCGKPPYYGHKTTSNRLSAKPPHRFDGFPLINKSYALVEANRIRGSATYGGMPSKMNWTLRQRTDWSAENGSPEVILERKIVKALEGKCFNQMPTASGLMNEADDKRSAIDLIYKRDKASYEFIELKVESDTPLFAAIEILEYGILYLYARRNLSKLGYRTNDKCVLRAENIGLRVLAPASYFEGRNFAWLEEGLNDGLSRFLDRVPDLKLRMDFRFDAFVAGFTGLDRSADPLLAFEARRAVYSRP